ncbi:hypothetical protein JTE90_015460 [Oedothorax gibbosus]|uniref:Integrase catalytic domain-containing protein n=1 Tax=Oedothorax gibbosus TaxID=931172 RepID=A0AAV6UB87_9ARAC|nr:hypothetical protein JTE90_015460 [Oedothorax gibbosus]
MRSALYQEFCNMLGTNRIQTTANHPISNGIVERFHRHLKASIKAHENSAWSEVLPVVLLIIRTAVKEDVNASCAELLYGTPLRFPSDMIENNITQASCTEPFVTNLVNNMRNTNPFASSPHCVQVLDGHLGSASDGARNTRDRELPRIAGKEISGVSSQISGCHLQIMQRRNGPEDTKVVEKKKELLLEPQK